MPRKPTFEEVKEEFESRGYTLLETEYKNTKTHMRYCCPKHPDKENKIIFSALKRGIGCRYCGSEAAGRKLKLTYEEIKGEFSKRGYELLETTYINATVKMRYKCPEHPDKALAINLHNLKKGHGCAVCSSKMKHTYEEVKEEFNKRGYELLENVYINSKTNMRYRCPRHPDKENKIVLNSLKSGFGCYYCGREVVTEKQRGENSRFWNGGLTVLNHYLRENLPTTRDWKKESLEKHNYSCVITNETGIGNLHIHHPKPFHIIRDEALSNVNLDIRKEIGEYTREELDRLTSEFERLHSEWEGMPMKKDIHKLFHSVYGHTTTIEDVYDFKVRYKAGEFAEAEPEDEQIELMF